MLKQYLKFLEDGNVISTLTKKGRGLGELDKPDKIYLNNTNFVYALGEVNGVDTGSIRETFFANALSGFYKLNTVDKGDFLVNETFTFEVGGKNKRFTQVKDVKDAYLALDEIETGINRKIPLWLFGFLY